MKNCGTRYINLIILCVKKNLSLLSSLWLCEGLSNQRERVTIDYAVDKNCSQFIRYECTICVFIAVSLLLDSASKNLSNDISEILQWNGNSPPCHYIVDLWSNIFIIEVRAKLYIYIARKFDNTCNLNFKYKTEFEEVVGDALRNISPCKQIDLLYFTFSNFPIDTLNNFHIMILLMNMLNTLHILNCRQSPLNFICGHERKCF